MGKREAQPLQAGAVKDRQRPRQLTNPGPDPEMGDFEDEYEDEFESEGEVVDVQSDDDDGDEIMVAGVDGRPDEELEQDINDATDRPAFIPGRHQLAAGEVLMADPGAYEMLHSFETTWPCLSCDIVVDSLGHDRKSYPATVYAVGGTQASQHARKNNQLLVLKMSQLGKMKRSNKQNKGDGDDSDEDDSEDDSDDDEMTDEPVLDSKVIPQPACTNRIRLFQPGDNSPAAFTASMLETGQVHVHNIGPHLAALADPTATISSAANNPVSVITAHGTTEGYAVDWAPSSLHPAGLLLTGDHRGQIFVSSGTEAGTFVTDSSPFTGHSGSIEELHWSPSERTVFGSGGDDGTVRIWDTRASTRKPLIAVTASKTDVNVLSWSRTTSHLLASGHDDGSWAVWDLRTWKPSSDTAGPSPLANFSFHQDQVTSLEWHPTDDSVMLAAAGDNTLSLWDLSVEFDEEENRQSAGQLDVPPQLLFVHYMEGVKEGHWHSQLPGTVVATGASGLNIFKTISV